LHIRSKCNPGRSRRCDADLTWYNTAQEMGEVEGGGGALKLWIHCLHLWLLLFLLLSQHLKTTRLTCSGIAYHETKLLNPVLCLCLSTEQHTENVSSVCMYSRSNEFSNEKWEWLNTSYSFQLPRCTSGLTVWY
jgi:hypothetical protein